MLAGWSAGVAEHQGALATAALEPVVALVAGQRIEAFVADDDIVAEAAQDDVVAATSFDVVVAVAAEDVVKVAAAIDRVVAVVAMDDVGALGTNDRVVAVAAIQEVGAALPFSTSLPPSPHTASSSAMPAVNLSLPSVPPSTMVLPRKLSSPTNRKVPSGSMATSSWPVSGLRVQLVVSNVPLVFWI